MKKVMGIVCILGLSLLAFSCSRSRSAPEQTAPRPVETIRLGINRSIKSAPIIIAEENGFLAEQSLDVQLLVHPSVTGMMDAIANGLCDLVCVPEYQIAEHALTSTDFKVIAVLNRNQSRALIVNSERISRADTLKGKIVGLAGNSAADYTLYQVLVSQGLSLGDVTIKYHRAEDLPAALEEGAVDAIITWSPFIQETVNRLESRAVVSNAHQGRDMYWLLVAEKNWAAEHRQPIQRLLYALEKAYQSMKADPAKARSVISETLSLNAAMLEDEWPDYRFTLEIPQSLILAMEQEASWLLREKKTGALPDFLGIIDYSYLDAVFPEKVTLIRLEQ